jgi:hypothetical protein
MNLQDLRNYVLPTSRPIHVKGTDALHAAQRIEAIHGLHVAPANIITLAQHRAAARRARSLGRRA